MVFKIPLFLLCFCLTNCSQPAKKKETFPEQTARVHQRSYKEIIEEIKARKAGFYKEYEEAIDKSKVLDEVKEYWVNSISDTLYKQWEDTPWDFNGTTRKPKEGSIACGYFVTTLLLDMGYQLDRVKLSTCASLTMMKKLTSPDAIRNFSYLSYEDFNRKIRDAGKGVFIIGLDYHTGFLINDGTETWFLHSNYIGKEGVIKEKINESAALKASGTRFVTCLTRDNNFLLRWINNQET